MNKNNNLYNENFYKQIISIIGSPENFSKSNSKNRLKISNKLKNLSFFTDTTNLLKNTEIDFTNFEIERKLFEEIFIIEMEKKVERSDSSILKNQLNLIIKFILEHSIKSGYIDDKIKSNNYIEKLKSDKILYIMIVSLLSSVRYIHLNDVSPYEQNENEIERSLFINNLIHNLILHICIIIFEDNIQFSTIITNLYDDIPIIISNSQSNTQGQCFTKCPNQLISIFSHVFKINSRIVKHKDNNNQFKSTVLMSLTDDIMDFNIPSTHIPEIIEPDINHDSLKDYITYYKKIKNGISNVTLSSEATKALILSQKKKFKINKNTIKVLKDLDNLNYEEIKDLDLLPFTPTSHLNYLKENIDILSKEVPKDLELKIKRCYYDLLKDNKFYSDIDNLIIQKLNITQDELEKSRKLYQLNKEYKKRYNLRSIHNTIIRFAEIFDGFPIYFINSYDYRLRMYPWNYMFNRTSGVYKYLLNEWPSNVDLNSLLLMIKAYYKNDLNSFKKFENLTNKDEIIKLFEEIEINLSIKNNDNKSDLYRVLLGLEIKNMKINKYKSGFMIEIDQKSSASVILSIILGDEILAEETNLILKSEPKDVNNYIMNKSGEWFQNKISNESLEFIKYNRNIHKYLFMCFIYNESNYGRMKRVRDYIQDDKDVLFISSNYPSFINSIFPNVYKKKELINNIIRFYLEKSDKNIELETIDGCFISWSIFNKNNFINAKIKYLDPITNQHLSVAHKVYNSDDIKIQKIILGLLPNLIHSIDGAIMRLIINDVYNETDYIINHLHDSIQLNPKHYNSVIKSIEKIYTSDKLNDVLNKYMFKKLENNLLEEHRIEFNKKIKEFKSMNYSNIKIDKDSFDARNMFPFE